MDLGARRLEELIRQAGEGALSADEQAELLVLGREYPEVGHKLLAESLSLNLLRSCSADEVEASDRFTTETVRLIQTDQKKLSLKYWMPALAGASVAAALLFALLQVISRPDTLPQFRVPKVEARTSPSSESLFPATPPSRPE